MEKYKMIKKFITKIKDIWKKLKEYFTPIPEPTKKEIFLALYEHIKINHSNQLNMQCLCGNFLFSKDIEMQFCKDFVWIIHDCPKCNMRNQRRYDYTWNRLKDLKENELLVCV